MKFIIYCLLIISLASLLAACGDSRIKPDDPQFAPVYPRLEPKATPKNGSLFQDRNGLMLFGNVNSHRVGDIITITLNERTTSTKSSGVDIDKESTTSLLEGANATVLGRTPAVTIPGVGGVDIPLQTNQSRGFSGDASADQSNSLQGNISVTITEILPNGNFLVRGEKWMTLNNGDEYIRVSGILRKEDVTLDNTVSSTKLANARISYSGTGDLADSQKMGWLSRFFNGALWPF